MKTNFWKSAAALALGLAAMVACQKGPKEEPKNEAPVFPTEVIEKNVEAGETVELTFAANLDWELSIPASEQTKYWLDDAGMPASKVSGKAGNQTVSVVFSEDEYYDENVLCNVTLTMGGESKVIAKLTRLAINRSLEVYTAETNSWGGFKNNAYKTEKATALDLVTFEGEPTYAQRIKVVANYDWSLSLPEWCEGAIRVAAGETAPESLSGQAGQAVEIDLTGKLSEAVKAGASDFARFIDAADNTKSEQLALTLPAFENRVEFTEPATMDFNADGSASMSTIAYVLAMEGFVVKALEWDGKWHSLEFANWVTVQTHEGEEDASLLSQVALTLGVTENTGEERVADLFVFPASMADVTVDLICSSSDCSVFNDDYAPYHVGRITQAGKSAPFLTPVSTPELMAEVGTSFETLDPKSNPLYFDHEASEYFQITYTMEWSSDEGTFKINKPFASYKIYKEDPAEWFDKEAGEDFWMSFWHNGDKTMGKINVDELPASEKRAAVVFFDEAGNKIAAILFVYSPGASVGGGDALTDLSGTLYETLDATTALMYTSNLGINEVYVVAANAYNGVICKYSKAIGSFKAFSVDLGTNLNIAPVLMPDGQTFQIPGQVSGTEAIIVLYDANMIPMTAIYYMAL